MGKRVLVICQYFHPESFRINDICTEWVKRGYDVTVLTGIPNYPQGKFYEGYSWRKRRKEVWNGVKIIRIPLIARGHRSIGLVLNYLSFVVSGFIWNLHTNVKADLVFTYETSPMTQALIGVWYAKKHKIPHYIYVLDLWPENVEIITGIRAPIVIRPIEKMVGYIYDNSSRILTSSRSFVQSICRRGISEEKIEFWPQYAEDFYRPCNDINVAEIPRDGIFNLVFAGNIGYAQGLDVYVRTARLLKEENKKVRFNIIGNGRYMPVLKESILKANVEEYFNLIDRKPAEKIPEYLAAADALLISLAKSEVFSITIPAKTQSCMACGKPILVSADGEIQDIIREARCGLVNDSGDEAGLANSIKKLSCMRQEELNQMGANAMEYSRRHFSKQKLMLRIDQIFEGE